MPAISPQQRMQPHSIAHKKTGMRNPLLQCYTWLATIQQVPTEKVNKGTKRNELTSHITACGKSVAIPNKKNTQAPIENAIYARYSVERRCVSGVARNMMLLFL